MKKDKRILFTFNIDNVVDIITNSSSELFVLKGKTQEIVEEMLVSTYPDYLSEYEQVVSLQNLDDDTFESYINWIYNTYDYNFKGEDKYNSIEGIEPKDLYHNWDEQDNLKEGQYFWPKFSDEAIKLLKEKIDPENKTYLLYSIDENPNWERQEDLSDIGTRYHLG